MPWQDHLFTTRDAIRDLIRQTQRIAVLGIKTERQSFQPAFYVPAYLAHDTYLHEFTFPLQSPLRRWARAIANGSA
jgi:hypothetical protein